VRVVHAARTAHCACDVCGAAIISTISHPAADLGGENVVDVNRAVLVIVLTQEASHLLAARPHQVLVREDAVGVAVDVVNVDTHIREHRAQDAMLQSGQWPAKHGCERAINTSVINVTDPPLERGGARIDDSEEGALAPSCLTRFRRLRVDRRDHVRHAPWESCARFEAECAERRRPLEQEAEGGDGDEQEGDHVYIRACVRVAPSTLKGVAVPEPRLGVVVARGCTSVAQ